MFAKVYGASEEQAEAQPHQAQNYLRCGNGVETVWFSEAQVEEVERFLREWKLWTGVGQAALERHERLQPHRWVSLSMIARLLDIASLLGRLSVGLPV